MKRAIQGARNSGMVCVCVSCPVSCPVCPYLLLMCVVFLSVLVAFSSLFCGVFSRVSLVSLSIVRVHASACVSLSPCVLFFFGDDAESDSCQKKQRPRSVLWESRGAHSITMGHPRE